MSESSGPASRARRVRAGAEGDGQRLDNFLLRELKGVPRSRIYRLLRKGEVRVNGSRAKPDQRLSADDEVRLPPVRLEPAAEGPRRLPAPLQAQLESAILHEDDRILVLDKPSGLAVHGGSGLSFGAIEALRLMRPDESLELAHRLDRDTSGCLIITRTRPALRALHALLREGQVDKHYSCLMAGQWQLGRKVIEAPVLTHLRQGGARMVKVHAEGKAARTRFEPQRKFGRLATLMDVAIDTGRMHQIRVHAAFAGHPVAGDEKYGEREFNARMRELGLRRLFLHCREMAFCWPDTGERVQLQAPLAPDLAAVVERLAGPPGR